MDDGLSRPEFETWLAKFRRAAPTCVPDDQRKIDDYYDDMSKLPIRIARDGMATKLRRASPTE